MMIINSSFKPAWWLPNAHAQTVYASLRHPVKATIDKVENIELPDGDFLNLVWSTANLPADAPVVVILHGLSGCLKSSYVSRYMQAFNRKGWRAVLMHFRGAGEKINRLPRAYHSGDTADLKFLINLLNQREPETKKAVVGVSMGGNVLLKWLGETGDSSQIHAGVAISVPFVLSTVANTINLGFARVYQARLLGQLKAIFARKMDVLESPPEAIKKAAQCTCFWTFDAHVTAPLHGFNNVHTYYRESSSRQYLKHIKSPTLIIHSRDDPFMTEDVLPLEAELSKSVILELSQKGGHAGFVSGKIPGIPIYWSDQRIVAYIEQQFI